MHFRSWGLAACLCVLVLFGLLAFSQLGSPGTTADAAPPPTATPTVKPRNPADATPTGGSWTRLNPPPTDSNLNSVFSLDGQTAWAVGDDGAIIKTADGGTNWTAVSSGITNTLRSVKFADVQNGWAAGENGTIINTSDGGGSWTAQATGTTNPLYSIDFVDSRNGWAVGSNGTVLKTSDGGLVWASQTVSPTIGLSAVDFVDSQTGWAVGVVDVGSGEASVFKTSDGGVTWSTQTATGSISLSSVSFVNGQTGWAVDGGSRNGYTTVWKTTDGGSNWGAVKSFESTYVGTLRSVYFQDTQTGWAVGPYSRLLSTTNGGTSWMGIPTNWGTTYGSYRSVHFANAQTGWIVGEGGLIIKSTDGGRTWQEQNRVLNMDLGLATFIDAQTGWAQASVPVDVDRSQRVVVKTTDGGATWSVQSLVNGWLSSLDAISSESLWALSTRDGVIYSSDGGVTWSRQSTAITTTLVSMDFVDDQTGWVMGSLGAAYKTADGGATWTSQIYDAPKPHFFSTGSVRGGDFWAVGETGNMAWLPAADTAWHRTGHGSAVAPYTLYSTASDWFWSGASYAAKTWAVGANGTILWAGEGPVGVSPYRSWGRQTSGVTETLYSVAVSYDYANPQGSSWTKAVGWAVGEKGTILSSGNGLAWTVRTSGVTETLYSVVASYYTDTYRVWVVGSNGTILNSADGGTSWTNQTSGVSQTLRSVFTLDFGHAYPVTLWAVGDRGMILKSTNDGISWTSQASGTTEDLRSVAFYDLLSGWAVGTKGTILKTNDGGATWAPQASGTINDLESVAICSNAGYTGRDCTAGPTAVAVAGAGATLLRSTDGGATWSALRYAADDNITSVKFLDAQHGWAWGSSPANLFLRTTDGGANWSAASNGASADLWIDFADANNGWAVGPGVDPNGTTVGTVLRSTDGGATWLPQTSPVTGTFWSSVKAVDAQTAWVSGSVYDGTRNQAVVLHTSDGGANWTRRSAGLSQSVTVFARDAQTVWGVGTRSGWRFVPSYPVRAYMPGVSKNHSTGW